MAQAYHLYQEENRKFVEVDDSIVALLTDKFSPAVIRKITALPAERESIDDEQFACNYGVVDGKCHAAIAGNSDIGYYVIDHLGKEKTVFFITDGNYGGYESQAHKISHRADDKDTWFYFQGKLAAVISEFEQNKFKIFEIDIETFNKSHYSERDERVKKFFQLNRDKIRRIL